MQKESTQLAQLIISKGIALAAANQKMSCQWLLYKGQEWWESHKALDWQIFQPKQHRNLSSKTMHSMSCSVSTATSTRGHEQGEFHPPQNLLLGNKHKSTSTKIGTLSTINLHSFSKSNWLYRLPPNCGLLQPPYGVNCHIFGSMQR